MVHLDTVLFSAYLDTELNCAAIIIIIIKE